MVFQGETNIEPSQPTPRPPQRSPILTTSALLQIEKLQEPILGCNRAKEILLIMKVIRDIIAQQRKKARNRKRLVAIPQDFKINGLSPEKITQKADDAVDRDHEDDPDNVFLLVGFDVVDRVLDDEEEGHYHGYQPEDGGEEEAEVVEGEALP
jgi:hypothetical protein